MRPTTLRAFYRGHQVRRPDPFAGRLETVRTARPLTGDRALVEVSILEMQALVAEMRLLEKHIAKMAREIDTQFAAHPEAALFENLPGAGAAMAPRLGVIFGVERERRPSAAHLQNYCGISPVTEKSGRQQWVDWRWNAPHFARQTLVEWAGLTVKYSAWARAYYEQQKDRQRGHAAILRRLAFKWLRILWRCWQERIAYDEPRYLARLKKRHPILFALIPGPAAP